MTDRPTVTYVTASVVAAGLAVVGAWLPWVRKRPVDQADGGEIITTEYVWGLETGIRAVDAPLVGVAVAVVGIVVLARYLDWRPDWILVGGGGILLYVAGTKFYDYLTVERYLVGPGLYLLGASGLLFVSLGTGVILKRWGASRIIGDENSRVRTE